MIHSDTMNSYLSINPERAAIFLQLDGRNSWNFPGLLDVCAVAADGETHQVLSHRELLLERWCQLLCALRNSTTLITHQEKHSSWSWLTIMCGQD